MTTFLLRRLLSVPLLLIGVALITFILQRMSPGDFFMQMEMDPSKSINDVIEQKENAGLVRRLHDDEKLELHKFVYDEIEWEVTEAGIRANGTVVEARNATALRKFKIGSTRYLSNDRGEFFIEIGAVEGFLRWPGNAAVLDFGESFQHRRAVFPIIGERLWNTLKLSLTALVLAWGMAIPLGVLAAVRINTLPDHLCALIAFLGLSIPSVFFSLLMVLFASISGWFPIGDMRDVVNYESFTLWEKIWDEIHHLILPSFVIGSAAAAGYMRQTRGNMVETLNQDYVRTARAKGLSSGKVLFKHALRNAINPLITLFGYSLAALLTGSFLVEVVFNWPGMARLVVDAIIAKDEPIVMASVIMSSLLLVSGNLIADVLLAISDPRVRLS